MSRHRFFLEAGTLAEGQQIHLTGTVAHRVGHVLRLCPGDTIYLLDGSGREAEARIASVGGEVVTVSVQALRQPATEPRTAITLYQALIAADRFEWLLEKATELGVARFVPTVCARNTSKSGDAAWIERKRERWQAIIRSAAEQSGRVRLPHVDYPLPLPRALDNADGAKLLAWEESSEPLGPALAAIAGGAPHLASLFVGPEGGFTTGEAEQGRLAGAIPVSLGPRILRAETAGIVLCTLVLHEMRDL